MHLFKFAPLLSLPLVLASPAPAPQTTGGLLSELPDIVDNVQDLITKENIDDLVTIIKGGAVLLGGDTPKNLQRLLSGKNIDKLQDIVDNAHTLITTQFVNQTGELVGDAAPVCSLFPSTVYNCGFVLMVCTVVGLRCVQVIGWSSGLGNGWLSMNTWSMKYEVYIHV